MTEPTYQSWRTGGQSVWPMALFVQWVALRTASIVGLSALTEAPEASRVLRTWGQGAWVPPCARANWTHQQIGCNLSLGSQVLRGLQEDLLCQCVPSPGPRPRGWERGPCLQSRDHACQIPVSGQVLSSASCRESGHDP